MARGKAAKARVQVQSRVVLPNSLLLLRLAGLLDLPTELLYAILDCLALPAIYFNPLTLRNVDRRCSEGRLGLAQRRKALSALSQTCKALNSLVIPYLYSCLLNPASNRLLDNALLSIAATNAGLLRHANQVEIVTSALSILKHTGPATG